MQELTPGSWKWSCCRGSNQAVGRVEELEEIFTKARRRALGFSPMDVSYAARRRNLPLLHFHLHCSQKEWMDSSLAHGRGKSTTVPHRSVCYARHKLRSRVGSLMRMNRTGAVGRHGCVIPEAHGAGVVGSRHQQEEKSWTHRISSSAITFAIAWTCKREWLNSITASQKWRKYQVLEQPLGSCSETWWAIKSTLLLTKSQGFLRTGPRSSWSNRLTIVFTAHTVQKELWLSQAPLHSMQGLVKRSGLPPGSQQGQLRD